MILVYFPSGGCVDDVVNNRTNHHLMMKNQDTKGNFFKT